MNHREKTMSVCQTPGCESNGDAETPREALPGLQICLVCRDRLENDLLGLPKLYDDCVDVLTFDRTVKKSGEVRTEMVETLSSWAKMIVEERGVRSPNLSGIWQLSTFLLIHFDWLVRHPAAAEFAGQVAGLSRAAHAVVHPDPAGPSAGQDEAEMPAPEDVPRQHRPHVVRPDQWMLLNRKIQRAKRVTWRTPGRAA
ncbi:hypothetical protein SAMN05421504_107340 [Amycolatopsis xylanica]|uniref:Uncharacterized protein n=2 Tax=Amycolatopsis xylanica TaxID=589385 RepID=A0A1H3NKQ0_9PSEU|nr:hypothetical protein SAMN05421504_107340 [Amycolatopsis xylanica]